MCETTNGSTGKLPGRGGLQEVHLASDVQQLQQQQQQQCVTCMFESGLAGPQSPCESFEKQLGGGMAIAVNFSAVFFTQF